MKFTVRFAHLAEKPLWKVGDTIKRGDVIGIMGSTGKSTANHLHIDCVEGVVSRPFNLAAMTMGDPKPNENQLKYFVDEELFGIEPVITTAYNDPEYFATYGKWHPAYDVVPEDRERWEGGVKKGSKKHFAIHWNRSYPGKIENVVDDPKGYGYCVYISFDVGGEKSA